jgi:hypothetical protein
MTGIGRLRTVAKPAQSKNRTRPVVKVPVHQAYRPSNNEAI